MRTPASGSDRPVIIGPDPPEGGGGRSALHRAVDFLLPPACLGCRRPLPPAARTVPVCGRCLARLRPPTPPRCFRCDFPRGSGRLPGSRCIECEGWPPHLRATRSAVLLAPPADALIHALKYGGWRGAAPLMVRRMAGRRFPEDVEREARIVVPVPTTRTRERRRGYNQAAVLARGFAAETGRVLEEALVRRDGRGTQVSLQPLERRANVAGAFSVAEGCARRLRDEHVLLVDDVLTTGATVLAAADVLHRAGCRQVSVATFARALPGPDDGPPGRSPSAGRDR